LGWIVALTTNERTLRGQVHANLKWANLHRAVVRAVPWRRIDANSHWPPLDLVLGDDAPCLDVLAAALYALEDVEVVLDVLKRGPSGRPSRIFRARTGRPRSAHSRFDRRALAGRAADQ
jgi:hypothetical protein